MKKSNFAHAVILAASLLLQLSILCLRSHAAAGDVDLSFDPGSGVNGFVWAVVAQPDGKLLIGGQFTTVRGLSRTNVARLNADGSGDATFDPGANYDSVNCLALQADGKVLVGGSFIGYAIDEFGNGYEFQDWGVTRLNANGSRDGTFTPASVPFGILAVASQPDGKVLMGGNFVSINGTNRSGIARLEANGNLDSSFDPGTGIFGYPGGVHAITVQPDGKVLIGGGFTAFNGTQRGGLARLHANGSLDDTFDPGTGFSSPNSVYTFSIALQPDGKMLVGGTFTGFNGTNRNGIARLNANGSLDLSFNPGAGVADAPSSYYGVGVKSVVMQPDGKVLIGGDFNTVNGANRIGIARLNVNGGLDPGFNPGTFVLGGYGTSVALQSDGKVFIAANRIRRLNTDGSADGGFDPGLGVNMSPSLALQSDGKLLLGGDGDQRALICGTNRHGSARLNANGSVDNAFSPGGFAPNIGDLGFAYDERQITAMTAQPDGRVLVAALHYIYFSCDDLGCLTGYRFSITRHHADGSRDLNFEPTVQEFSYPNMEFVNALGTQSDGKILVGGRFASIKGANRSGLARLNAGGSLDGSFIGEVPFPHTISVVVAQPNGKILIVSTDGGNHGGLSRFNADGSPDLGFNTGTISGDNPGPYPTIRSVLLQPDGRVLIGGSFTNVNGTTRNGIARLNADGGLDSGFNPGTGANAEVVFIALQPDGKVLLSGRFTTVNGVVRPSVARLIGDSPWPTLSLVPSAGSLTLAWPATALNLQLEEATDLSLPDAWSAVAQAPAPGGAQGSVTVPTGPGQKFFRLKSR